MSDTPPVLQGSSPADEARAQPLSWADARGRADLIADIDRELNGPPGSPDARRQMLARARDLLAFAQQSAPPASEGKGEAEQYRELLRATLAYLPSTLSITQRVRSAITATISELPQCRECGASAPNGDPCSKCRLRTAIAAKDAERGRPLTASEQLGNLERSLAEDAALPPSSGAAQQDVGADEARAREAYDATRQIGGLFWTELPEREQQRLAKMLAFAQQSAPPASEGEGLVLVGDDAIRERLFSAAREHAQSERRSGLTRWCRERGVNRHHVNEWLHGKRAPQSDMLDALGLQVAVVSSAIPASSPASEVRAKALAAIDELANTQMNLSLERWGELSNALLAALALPQSSGAAQQDAGADCPFIAGNSWKEPEDDCWTSEVQIVGGHYVVATVHGSTQAEAESRRDVIIAALAGEGVQNG